MISIITAYYNRKELFRKTLASIARFNYSEPIEFIAVDDGSKEEERIEDLQVEFPFLRVVRLEKKINGIKIPVFLSMKVSVMQKEIKSLYKIPNVIILIMSSIMFHSI